MIPIDAVYIRMNGLLINLGTASVNLYREINDLKDRLQTIGISWSGTAYEAYSMRLFDDLRAMEHTAAGIVVMCELLYSALSMYQQTEMKVADIIGGLRL
ncbi:MAG: hypothetical protein IKP31_02465 [Lachnospiraceae bacterium]|nr:hypothetical protein [Lachnospiraceae bacterium]